MNIRKTIVTTIVAATTVAMIAPGIASADIIADLQAQINALMAQLAALQAGQTTTGGIPAACAGVTFTRNLMVGSTGQDVKCLQALLNTSPATQVASSGPGSPGNETSYFGPKTLAAVKKYQSMKGWTPANQVGPLTRAALNAWLQGSGPGTPGQPPQTGPVSVMLSPNTPAEGTSIVGGQATAELARFTFTGSGTVTSITLKRTGISDQNTLSNVYLFDGNIRITDGYSFNVNGNIVMNGLSIMVNGSKEISVRADVDPSAPNNSSTIAVSLVGYTANGMTNTANVMGKLMSIVVGNLASAHLGANTTPSSANVNAGTSSYVFWSSPLQINTRAVLLKMAFFRMIGSAPSDALGNPRLFIDGVDTGKVATVMNIIGSNYLVFDLASNPINLGTGSHTVDLRANIEKGTNRTVQISLQQASDFMLTDSQVGVNIALLGPGGIAFSANSGTNVSILTGSVTVVVDPAFAAMTDVPGGSANAVIGKFRLHAYGEDVKVTSFSVIPSILGATSTGSTCTTSAITGAVTSGTCGINNVTLYFNGSQVGSQVNYSAGTYTMGTVTSGTAIVFNLGSQMILPAGQDSIVEVRADLQTTNNVAYTGGTIGVGLPAVTTNAQGMSSQATVGVPTAAINTTGLNITTSNLAVSKNSAYLDQNISPNTPNVKIGSYIAQNQSTSQSVRITSLSIATTTTTATISNFSALKTSVTSGSGSTPIQFSGAGSGTTSTDVFSVNETLAPGQSLVIDIFANTGSATSGTIATTLDVTSIGSVDNISTTSGPKTGQTLTLGTGTIGTPTLVVSSSTPSQYIAAAGGASNATQATFNFVSTSGSATITELKFTVSGSDASPSNTVTNVCVGSICASPVSGVAHLVGLNLAVPNGGAGLNANVLASYSSVGTGGIDPSNTSQLVLTFMKYTSGGTTTTNSALSVPATVATLVGSKPSLTVASGGSTGMILNSSTKVGQVTVTADSKGAIKVRQFNFALGYSGYTTNPSGIASAFLALGGQSTAIPGVTCTAVSTTNVVCKTTTNGGTFSYADDIIIGAGQSQQFDLYVTTSGGANTGNAKAAISTTLVNGSSTSSTAGTTSAFLWDDTSNNGGTGSTGLTGVLIYGFPTNAYSVSQ